MRYNCPLTVVKNVCIQFIIRKFIQKRYQQEARRELEEKLGQVSQFLAKQSEAHDRLERLRAENLQNKEHSALKRIGELEAELSLIKQRGIPGSAEMAVQPYGDKYQKLYREECRARERSDNSARRKR